MWTSKPLSLRFFETVQPIWWCLFILPSCKRGSFSGYGWSSPQSRNPLLLWSSSSRGIYEVTEWKNDDAASEVPLSVGSEGESGCLTRQIWICWRDRILHPANANFLLFLEPGSRFSFCWTMEFFYFGCPLSDACMAIISLHPSCPRKSFVIFKLCWMPLEVVAEKIISFA